MDDTLYLERDFVFSGYSHIAQKLENLVPSKKSKEFLKNRFLQGLYKNQFSELVAHFPELQSIDYRDLVCEYRYHQPAISLSQEVKKNLQILKTYFRLGLISDGDKMTQSNKVNSLGLCEFLDEELIILTGEYGIEYYKPHSRAFLEIENKTGCIGSQNTYVADNQKKDFISPNQLGWTSVKLEKEGQIYSQYYNLNSKFQQPKFKISNIYELLELDQRKEMF